MATTEIISAGAPSAQMSSPTARAEAGAPLTAADAPPRLPSEPADRITLFEQEQNVEQKKKKEPEAPSIQQRQARMMQDVLFSYNFRGDLRIKFMDSVNKLVYQTPPYYFSRLSDLMMMPSASVDTKV